MMKIIRLQKDKKKIENNISKNIRNLFRIKKEISETAIKDIRYIFRLKKKRKKSKTRELEILEIFLSMKNNIIINH